MRTFYKCTVKNVSEWNLARTLELLFKLKKKKVLTCITNNIIFWFVKCNHLQIKIMFWIRKTNDRRSFPILMTFKPIFKPARLDIARLAKCICNKNAIFVMYCKRLTEEFEIFFLNFIFQFCFMIIGMYPTPSPLWEYIQLHSYLSFALKTHWSIASE